jgi:hypothetical protein
MISGDGVQGTEKNDHGAKECLDGQRIGRRGQEMLNPVSVNSLTYA